MNKPVKTFELSLKVFEEEVWPPHIVLESSYLRHFEKINERDKIFKIRKNKNIQLVQVREDDNSRERTGKGNTWRQKSKWEPQRTVRPRLAGEAPFG